MRRSSGDGPIIDFPPRNHSSTYVMEYLYDSSSNLFHEDDALEFLSLYNEALGLKKLESLALDSSYGCVNDQPKTKATRHKGAPNSSEKACAAVLWNSGPCPPSPNDHYSTYCSVPQCRTSASS